MKLIFYAQLGVRILALRAGKFRSDFLKFDAFDMQESDDMMLLHFPRSGTSELFTIYISGVPTIFVPRNRKPSEQTSISRLLMDPVSTPPEKGKTIWITGFQTPHRFPTSKLHIFPFNSTDVAETQLRQIAHRRSTRDQRDSWVE
jgi:hypothetical protein